MKKEFVKYEQALALKELGFDEPCFANYNIEGILQPIMLIEKQNTNSYFASGGYFKEVCTAPTFSQAFRWFREKYAELDFGVAKIHNGINNYHYHINLQWEFFEGTYEEAELACLDKLIEIVKNK